MKNSSFNIIQTIGLGILLIAVACKKDSDSNPNPNPNPVTCSEAAVDRGFLPSDFTKDTTLASGTYTMKNDCTVRDGFVLTLSPGTTIQAQSNNEFIIKGGIRAVGTASCPIVFTSKTKSPGSWYGVVVYSNDPDNKFENCSFEYGGYGNSAVGKTCLKFTPYGITGSARAGFNNCTFSNSSGYGFVSTRPENILNGLDNCSFKNNGDAPLLICWEMAGSLNSNCTYTGNTNNYIELIKNGIIKSCTLAKQPLPFQIYSNDGYIAFKPYTLTVGAGVTLITTGNNHFIFDDASKADFQGTASEPIIIKSKSGLAGSWGGFLFRDNSNDNIFRYVNFSDGGNAATNGIYHGMINLKKYSVPSRVTIENCTFSNSNNYGVAVEDEPGFAPHNIINGITGTAIIGAVTSVNSFASNVGPEAVSVYK